MASVISCFSRFPLAYGRVHIIFLVLLLSCIALDWPGRIGKRDILGTERLNSASRAADKATLIFLAAHTIGIVDRGIFEPDRRLTKRCNKAAIRVVTAM
jgi:hypothetical protein